MLGFSLSTAGLVFVLRSFLFIDALSTLILHGANTSIKAQDGNSLLHAAALNGDYETLLTIVKRGNCDISSTNKTHDTPLHLICAQEKLPDTKSIQFLLEKGASLDAK